MANLPRRTRQRVLDHDVDGSVTIDSGCCISQNDIVVMIDDTHYSEISSSTLAPSPKPRLAPEILRI